MLFSLNPCKIYSFAPKEGGGKWGVCPIRHSACVALIKPPSPGARLPWAMTPCINRVIAACSHAGGVPFSSLSPFLFRYILSCLQSSFSIKRETDRDRTHTLYCWLSCMSYVSRSLYIASFRPNTVNLLKYLYYFNVLI